MFATKHPASSTRVITALAFGAVAVLSSQEAAAGEWMAGGNVFAVSASIVGEDEVGGLIPVVAYRGERFHANLGNPGISFFNGISDIGGIGYSVIKEEHYNLDLVGKIRAMGLDPDDNDELDGLNTRRAGFDAGISARWDTGYGELNGQLLADISNRSKGQEAVFSYAYPLHFGQWTLRPELGVSWQSSDLTDYYYGVDEDETAADRAFYEADATVTPFAAIQAEYALTSRTHLIGGVGVGRLGDGISDSPIVDERNLIGGYFGAVYHF